MGIKPNLYPSFHPLIAGRVSQTPIGKGHNNHYHYCFHPLIAGRVSQTEIAENGPWAILVKFPSPHSGASVSDGLNAREQG